jgi:hypothetical protein
VPDADVAGYLEQVRQAGPGSLGQVQGCQTRGNGFKGHLDRQSITCATRTKQVFQQKVMREYHIRSPGRKEHGAEDNPAKLGHVVTCRQMPNARLPSAFGPSFHGITNRRNGCTERPWSSCQMGGRLPVEDGKNKYFCTRYGVIAAALQFCQPGLQLPRHSVGPCLDQLSTTWC